MYNDAAPTTNRQRPPFGLYGRQITWCILAGGFLVGVLGGAVLIFGSADGSAKRADVATSVETTTSFNDPSSLADQAEQFDTADLLVERERLQKELDAERLRREVDTLRRELSNLRSSPVSIDSPSHDAAKTAPSIATPASASAPLRRSRTGDAPPATSAAGPTGEATLAYWNKMNDVILQEATLRSAPSGGITAMNAAGFLDARIHAAEFAVNTLRSLDATCVDPRVVTLGGNLIGWYSDGQEVAKSGKQLLTSASMKERQGTAGKQYQAAEKHHSESVNAINAEGEQVRKEMSNKYRIAFPPLN